MKKRIITENAMVQQSGCLTKQKKKKPNSSNGKRQNNEY